MKTRGPCGVAVRRAFTLLGVTCVLGSISWANTNAPARNPRELLTADERAWLTTHGPITYSAYPAAPPFGFVRPDTQLDGVAREVMNLLASKLRASVKPIAYPTWTETLAGIRHGEFDVVAGIPRTPEREAYLDFTEPCLSVPVALFVDRARSKIKGIGDLEERSVCVVRDTAEHDWMRHTHPGVDLEEVDTPREGLLLVAVGKSDGMVLGLPIGHALVAENALGNLGVVPETLFVAPHHLAVLKGQDRLRAILQKGLNDITPQEFRAIMAKWTQPQEAVPWWLRSPWLWRGALVLLAGLLAFIVWTYSLRRRVASQARLIRAQVEQEAQLERRHSELIENATDMVLTRDLEGNYKSINPAGERLLGYSRDEFLRMNVSQVIIPEHMGRLRQAMAALIARGSSMYEVQVRTKDGRLLWLEASLRLLHKDGQPFGVQGIARDITERHRAVTQLRESELLYHSLVEQLPQAIYRTDREGHITFANSRCCQMFGRPLHEILGRTDIDLFPMEQVEKRRADDLRAMETGKTSETVERHTGPAGQETFVQMLRFPLRDADGQISGVQCLFWDVTERKQAEEALRTSRQLLALHVEQTPLGVIEWDLYFQVTSWNAAAERIFGYTAAEAIGRHSAELLVPPDVRPQVNKVWDALVAQRGGSRSTNRNITKDGREIFCEWYNTPLVDASGSVIAVASLVLDVTERHHAEETRVQLEVQLRQAQKMEAVGQLAGGAAHDFNNILTVILGNARLLEEDANLSPSSKDQVQELIKAGEQAANLTHQLLAFSRRNVMQTHVVDLNEALADITQMLARLIGEDISLECKCSPAKLKVKIDAGLIKQVIVNIAVNARDAMPDGGRLMIETELEAVSAAHARRNPEARPGEFATLTITDTGCGMNENTRSHIFEPFFTTKEIGKGSGLGLATAYGIVRQHGGWIECASEINRGTTFKILLPTSPSSSHVVVAPRRTLGEPSTRGAETLLVVEDDDSVRQFLHTCLKKQGYNVLLASGGNDALRVWESARDTIDLLLTDIVMPGGMTGRELAERLRAARPDLKIIFSSGYSRDASESNPDEIPGQIFLSKPYSPSTLTETVRRCLDVDFVG
ncbi:MAG TPA: PAS domain S-box protein [Verrucomicrobiae bacterium]|nr:PAS domain S-box protein [Verrucomicrobiae bacterium]